MAGTRSTRSPASSVSNNAGLLSEPRRRPATRSLSRITEDDSNDDGEDAITVTPRQVANQRLVPHKSTPRQSRRDRSRTATSTSERDPDRQTPRVKRVKLRPSLAGPQVHEMNIETRAQILIPIAEDCIVQLLKAGLNGDIYRDNANQTWRLAWESLQTQRRNRLFSPDSLPFNDFEDVREAFHSSVRGHINTASLERAIHLSNLASFLWVILLPDEAHTLLGDSEARSRASARSQKQLTVGDGEIEEGRDVRDVVSRRNRVFGMAWKRYWKDVIPQSMRGNKHSITLWAHLSVQIIMLFRSEVVDGDRPASHAADLPLPDPEFAAELFSASAIVRYGQWALEVPSVQDLATKETAQRRWTEVAKHHRKELREVREEVLVERYPYDGFRRELLGFVDQAVLHTLLSGSASPTKPNLDDLTPSTSASELEGDQDQAIQTDLEIDAEDEADVASVLGVEGLETVVGQHSATPDPTLDLDLVILAQVLEGMTPDSIIRDGEEELHTDEDDFPSDLNSGDDKFRNDDQLDIQSQDEESDWEVKETKLPRIRTRKTDQSFQFAARQASAEQVPWESEPQSRTPKRSARTPLFLPHQDSDSDASATPRAQLPAARDISIVSPRPGRLDEPEISSGIDDEELDDLMPGSSVLGTPVRVSRKQAGSPSSAPRPNRQRQLSVIGTQESNVVDDVDGPNMEGELRLAGSEQRSTSPSPRRPNGHGDALEAATPVVADLPPVSSSHKPATSSIRGHPVLSQRVLVNPRKRRRIDVGADFATVSSSEEDDDDINIHASRQVPTPPRRIVTSPRQTARRTLGPLRKSLQNIRQTPPQAPDPMSDFIKVPPFSHRTWSPFPDDRTRHANERNISRPQRSRASRVSGNEEQHAPQEAHNSRPERGGPSRDTNVRKGPLTGQTSISTGTEDKRTKHQARVSRSERSGASRVLEARDRPATPDQEILLSQRGGTPRLSEDEDLDATEEENVPRRGRGARVPEGQEDYYLHDEDGSPLEPDQDYRIARINPSQPSTLHGRKEDQVYQYTRLSGKRKWTKEEEILLYRTIQKIPLDEPSPLQVVWYLYGEYGVLSTELEDFNPQHMKDKMKTVVQVRYNNDRVIEGRARFWLPPFRDPDTGVNIPHPDRVALDEELARAAKERTRRERPALRAEAERKQREKDAKKAEKAEEARKAREAKKAAKKGKGKKRAARRSSTADELESDENEDEADEAGDNNDVIVSNTLEDDESYEPKRATRSKRSYRGPSLRGGATSRGGSQRDHDTPPVSNASQADVDLAGNGGSEDVTPNDTDAGRQPRRQRFIVEVVVPASRSVSRSNLRAAASDIRATDSHEAEVEMPAPAQGHPPTPDLSESEAETVYAGPSQGRRMRRSIGHTGPAPGTETLSVSDSEIDDDDATSSEEGTTDDEAPAGHDDVNSVDRDHDELLDQKPEQESDEDEAERNELIARRFELQQKVLGGHDP